MTLLNLCQAFIFKHYASRQQDELCKVWLEVTAINSSAYPSFSSGLDQHHQTLVLNILYFIHYIFFRLSGRKNYLENK